MSVVESGESHTVISRPRSEVHGTFQQVPRSEATGTQSLKDVAFLVFDDVEFFGGGDLGPTPYCILIIYYKIRQGKKSTLWKNHKFLCFVFSW